MLRGDMLLLTSIKQNVDAQLKITFFIYYSQENLDRDP